MKAPEGDPDPEQEGAQYGMIGLLSAGAGGDPDAPTASWGKGDSAALDASSLLNTMTGVGIGDAYGVGGLGLSGAGYGGGGKGTAIGLGTIGALGHGSGSSGALRSSSAQVKVGATTVSAGLDPIIVQRIVRQNFGRFRLCYENGLRSNPKLAGKVVTRFTIGKDGATSAVSLAKDTTMPDMKVSACVTLAFAGLSYPQPDGAGVTVVYPLLFSPAEDAAAPAKPAAAPAKPAAPATPKSP